MSEDKPENDEIKNDEAEKASEEVQEGPRVPSLDDLPPMEEEEKKEQPDVRVPTLPDAEPEAKNETKSEEAPEAPLPERQDVDFGDLQKEMQAKAETKSEEDSDSDGSETQVIEGPDASETEVNYVSSDITHIEIGDDIGLTNKDPTLKKIVVGAGWEVRSFEGEDPDLDLSCFIYNKDRQTRKDEDFVFYNNRQSEEGELKHLGDSRTGAGEGDDEAVEIDLQAFPFEVAGIMLVISIHDGEVLDQDLSMVKDMFIRIVNAETSQELCKLEIPDNYLAEKKGYAVKIGRIFRDGPKWRFHAATEVVHKGGLRTVATDYGIIVV